jgi:uncharacterized protein YeaO (DUF488 family)
VQALIKIKRAHANVDGDDGTLFLVDRVWPRGIRKEALKVDAWLRDVAPSTELRKWFGHDPVKWGEFRRRYFFEFNANQNRWRPIVEAERKGAVTLLFGAKDEKHNNAIALREYLNAHLASGK